MEAFVLPQNRKAATMLRDTGEMSIEAANDANVPVVIFLHEPDRPNGLWTWTAINFMPRKECCGGSYKLEADTKEEIMDVVRRKVLPLYEVAATNLRERGENYYWELPKNTQAVGRGPAAGTRTHEPLVGGAL